MKARLLDLVLTLDGKQRLTAELDGDFRENWDKLHDKDCDITVKRYRPKRSDSANAYAWVLIDKIAQKMRLPKLEVYRDQIREIGGVSEVVCLPKAGVKRLRDEWASKGLGYQVEEIDCNITGWKTLILCYGSSSYDTEQMAVLIDNLVQTAKQLGIETEPEEKIKSMLEEFDNAQQGKFARKVCGRSGTA